MYTIFLSLLIEEYRKTYIWEKKYKLEIKYKDYKFIFEKL